MNKTKASQFLFSLILFFLFCIFFQNFLFAEEPLWINWGYIFEELLVNRYYSHGCFHLTPLGAKIFYEVVPKGTLCVVKNYSDSPPSWVNFGVPDLLLCINSKETLEQAKEAFKEKDSLWIEAYPKPGIFVFYYNHSPYAKLRFRPGYEKKGYMYFGKQNGTPIYDEYQLTPTVAGNYFTFFYTRYLQASRYPLTTSIPYGEKIYKKGNGFFYKKNGKEYPVAREIAEDLKLPSEKRSFCFFDEVRDKKGQTISARWGSHDYGIYVVGLSADGKIINQDLIYATNTVLNDQRELIENLASLIVKGGEYLDESIKTTGIFKEEKIFFEFLKNPSGFNLKDISQETRQYILAYKIFNRLPLKQEEKKQIDPVYQAVHTYLTFGEKSLKEEDLLAMASSGAVNFEGGKYTFNREKAQGIYYSLYELANHVENGAKRYEKLKEFWPIFTKFKIAFNNSKEAPINEEKVKKIIIAHLSLGAEPFF